MVTIKNKELEVIINPIGAELQSIKDMDGTEFLWQGNPEYWSGRATNLFPFVGRLPGGKYKYKGNEYNMTSHGFCRGNEFFVNQESESRVEFYIESNEEFRAIYPFEFKFSIIYTLIDNKLEMNYKVVNLDDKDMFFGVGGHPGFNVPINDMGEFEDYYLEFDKKCQPNRMDTSTTSFMNGKESVYPLTNDDRIELQHDLFDNDAIILKDMSKVIRIKNDIGAKELEVGYPDMEYLALWHAVKMDAPYICIEPWASLPGRDVEIEDLEKHPFMIKLGANSIYENKWYVKVK